MKTTAILLIMTICILGLLGGVLGAICGMNPTTKAIGGLVTMVCFTSILVCSNTLIEISKEK